ncbi:MAG: transcriptional repressor LexA [Bacillota bacterium]|nr:transcriptional repressor LexA [Bacillota bacterium]MDW7729654.1 transcriptional repressor LexA [Bacillota bacterium]
MEQLTEKQKRVLKFIEQEVARCNYPPSVREIGKALGISSTATVHGYLDILESKGYISRMATKPRAIKLLRDPEGNPEMKCSFAPMIGRITAGSPVLAEENLEGYFPIPDHLASEEDCFVLQISGMSMINAGINDGDYVYIRQQNTADDGEIVAVLLEDEATVKRFYRDGGSYRLQPENDAYEPIITSSVDILGKVIGLFRKIQ